MQKYFDDVTNRNGVALPNATVTVTLTSSGALATIYSDNGVTTKANPITCDTNGYYEFYAPDGRYTLTVNGPGVTGRSVSDVLLQDFSEGETVSVTRFKLTAETSWDNAFARAITYVVGLATTANRTYGLPSIKIPGGRYIFTTGNIATFPWINFVSNGSVYLDFSAIPAANNGFVCSNVTTLPIDSLKHPANDAPWLNGSGGAIAVLGPGEGVSTGAAFKMGNFVSGGQPFRDAVRCNVVATGWGVADKWGNFDTYLCRTVGCRLESNSVNIEFPASSTNSGERMLYESCVLGGADTVLSINGSYDVLFRNCSADFNGSIVVFGSSASFCKVSFQGGHIEGFDGYIADASAVVSSEPTAQIVVSVEDCTILARSQTGAQGVNSPSRALFRGPISLYLNNIKNRTDKRPYLEDGGMIDTTVTVVRASCSHTSPWRGPLRLDAFINRDYTFQLDANGTLATALTAWDVVSSSSVVAPDLFTTTKKALRLVGSSGSSTSNITIRSKQSIPARAGDVFWTNATLYANGVTGTITAQSKIEFFDDAGTSLGSFPSFANYVFSDALADSTLPNFASAGDRWMDTSASRAIAPANTASAKVRFLLTGFDGTVYVSRARAWRDA